MTGFNKHLILFFILGSCKFYGQSFTRSELSTSVSVPWEIIYGSDGYLWLTESGGKVSRVDPVNGNKAVVYTAPDYFGGSPAEQYTLCHQPNIGAGTLGMALHPDFTQGSPYLYFVYSYNHGSIASPQTKFKIARLQWDANTQSIISATTLVQNLPSGYDHLGGRLMIIPQGGLPYLFFTIGDNGISEDNSPGCYPTPSLNPNIHAQDPAYQNGKIHRFNLDGSIPTNNPISGNSFYTRGHRNPQGLMYNSDQGIIFDIEHGDRTDDEINILRPGMNYGWKWVRGYHNDNNYPGEAAFISSYLGHPSIANDSLVEAFYSWCATSQPTISNNLGWCTPAPSDGIYYNSPSIAEWQNSLLVVTLKNGQSTDNEVYQFKLSPDGQHLAASTPQEPNPKKYFGADQALNGRLRDICYSPDGKKIYLVNNGGTPSDKIIVYSLDPASLNTNASAEFFLNVFPNPSGIKVSLSCSESMETIEVFDQIGQVLTKLNPYDKNSEVTTNLPGMYILKIKTESGKLISRKWLRL